MGSTTLERLFEGLAGGSGGRGPDMVSSSGLTTELAAWLAPVTSAANSGTQAAVKASAPAAANSTGQSAASTALSIASTVLESGLGLVPLISGLLGIFGGGGSPAPPPLVKYAMPERMNFESADTGGGISGADYDQSGMPRAYGGAQDGWNAPPAMGVGAGGATPTGGSGPQITVNVQAMDTQSFLDHSSEIAQAVRQAMLNLSSINDVVNELT